MTSRSFGESVAFVLAREAIEVFTAATVDDVASPFAVAVVDSDVDDWQVLLTFGHVIVFARGAGCDAVESLLASGADDVITRADRPQEAVARIRAVARRPPVARPRPTVVEGAGVVVDLEARVVTVDGKRASLTRTQFDLLAHLVDNAGHVVTRSSLIERIWGPGEMRADNAVEVQVRRVREAIERDPSRPTRIRTVRSLGYMFDKSSLDDGPPST